MFPDKVHLFKFMGLYPQDYNNASKVVELNFFCNLIILPQI